MNKELLPKKNPNRSRARSAAAGVALFVSGGVLGAALAPGDTPAHETRPARPTTTTTVETTTTTLPESEQPIKQERAKEYAHGQMQQIITRLTSKIGGGDLGEPVADTTGLDATYRRISDEKLSELGLSYGAVVNGKADAETGEIHTMFFFTTADGPDVNVSIYSPVGADGSADLSGSSIVNVYSKDTDGERRVGYRISGEGNVWIDDETTRSGVDDIPGRSTSINLSVGNDDTYLTTRYMEKVGDTWKTVGEPTYELDVPNSRFDVRVNDAAVWVNNTLSAARV